MNNSHDQVDPYQAPSAEITPASPSSSAPFYLVSPAKFSLLFWSTMGIYDLYWQYKNWALYREARGGGGLPVLRALFSIFFAPSLFHHIAREARAAGVPGTFRPSALAVVYVLGTLFSTVGNNLIDQPSLAGLLLWLGGLVVLLPVWWALRRCQKRINATLGDEAGVANSRITWANAVWIGLGGLLWLSTLWGLAAWGWVMLGQ